MFKIRIEDQGHYKGKIKEPYYLRYETVPDYSKGFDKLIYHGSRFSSLRIAQNVADNLSRYFDHSFVFLDLCYSKLKQLDNTSIYLKRNVFLDFNKLEKSYITVLRNREKKLYAFEHIAAILDFIRDLKLMCFKVCKEYFSTVNSLFSLLNEFHESFVSTYRNAQQFSDNSCLKVFV